MTKREKVLRGLCADKDKSCADCPYFGEGCQDELIKDCEKILSRNEEPAPAAPNLRPCLAKGWKGYFQQWANWQDADNLLYPVAIVEKEDGRCFCVDVTDIKFTDRSVKKND